ncbi:GNAT family N-acetyltransferase [Streptomyces sp. ET3-23]|uniref:GNAT family N-acetyltransferase n=1 Tax=Streptomyces sp. ET3-23 TaxID=2885643 RepID=UPI001D119DE5|nr:GNAT family N-acetyltransferase [Streptomyces sp. ET3-23]MCC2280988.1 GNAT family N-acetyltransferase [Streptomyces sp. ET3-23]
MPASTELTARGLPPPAWEVQTLPATQWQTFYAAVLNAFHENEPAEATALWSSLTEPQRCSVVRDEGAIVGTAGIFSFRMTVPGNRLVETAGVSMVSVQPTHRRRGVLSALMRHQLESLHRQGEPLAILTASEAPIYGRFGYGIGARQLILDVQSRRVALAAPATGDVALTLEDPHKALAACEDLYARQVTGRPGMLTRATGWEHLPLLDPQSRHDGSYPLECVVARVDGEVAGYARYTVTVDWSRQNTAQGTVRLRDIEADNPRVYAALWRFLLETDLTSRVIAPNRPVDDPFLHLVSDVRHCTPTVLDSLYVRVIDAPVALAARSYAAQIDIVLEIEDAQAPWNQGRWRLTGDRTGAICTRTHDAPDLSLDASALGSAYLGGTTLTELAAAGRICAHRPDTLTTAATAFTSPVAPWLPHSFCRSLLPRL